MSRSGYSTDCFSWDLIRWRGQVASAIRGGRGQSFLRELLEALDAMPDKRLIKSRLKAEDGCMCTLGVIGAKRGVDFAALDKPRADYEDAPYDNAKLGETFGIARQLAAEIMFENDEACMWNESPEQRWARMRQWVADQIKA